MASLAFPTARHELIADLAARFFKGHAEVDTVLVVNSCARGRATPESDLDLAVLVKPPLPAQRCQQLEMAWLSFGEANTQLVEFRCASRFAHVHVDVFDGQFVTTIWDDGGGPDSFEVEIGNRVASAVPLGEPGSCFRELQARWLPYYDDGLRGQRLAMVRSACLYDLERIPFLVRRGLWFSAFDYLYKAFQEFLQALFIARRIYPLSYKKWIREQVAERLALPELYRELPALLSVHDMETAEVSEKAVVLRQLLEQWTVSP